MRICSVEGCGRVLHAKGLCPLHYNRHRLGIAIDSPVRFVQPGRTCSIPGCDQPHSDNGLCDAHSRRARKYGLTTQAFTDSERVSRIRIVACDNCGSPLARTLSAILKSRQHYCGQCWSRHRAEWKCPPFNAKQFSILAVIEIRAFNAITGVGPVELARLLGVRQKAISKMLYGVTYACVPLFKKGGNVHEFIVEAARYRAKENNRASGGGVVGDGKKGPRPTKKQRVSSRGVPRKASGG